MKKKVQILFFCLFCSLIIFGQDLHFTQYYAVPQIFNPAATGFFDNDIRFSNNYRTQWSAINVPYQSISVAVDGHTKFMSSSNLGIGGFFVHDNSGGTKLTVNKFILSVSYLLNIRSKHNLAFGIQAGYVDKHFSLDGITFPSQFNTSTGYFDPELPSNTTPNTTLGYCDVNAGLNYSGKFDNIKPEVGLSFLHINVPKETFYDNNSRLSPRILLIGKVDISKQKWHYVPHLFTSVMQKAEELIAGCIVKRDINTKIIKDVFVGVSFRTSFSNIDATMLTFGTNIYGFTLAASYDVNISKLVQATNARGAFEISLIYELAFKKKRLITIPCDRF